MKTLRSECCIFFKLSFDFDDILLQEDKKWAFEYLCHVEYEYTCYIECEHLHCVEYKHSCGAECEYSHCFEFEHLCYIKYEKSCACWIWTCKMHECLNMKKPYDVKCEYPCHIECEYSCCV